MRKEESWQTQQQSQRRENATEDNSDERENHEVIRCVFVVRRLSGNHRLLQKNIAIIKQTSSITPIDGDIIIEFIIVRRSPDHRITLD